MTDIAAIAVGLICGSMLTALAVFIFTTYRLRQDPDQYARLIARLDVADHDPAYVDTTPPEAVGDDQPLTHYTPRNPWRTP